MHNLCWLSLPHLSFCCLLHCVDRASCCTVHIDIADVAVVILQVLEDWVKGSGYGSLYGCMLLLTDYEISSPSLKNRKPLLISCPIWPRLVWPSALVQQVIALCQSPFCLHLLSHEILCNGRRLRSWYQSILGERWDLPWVLVASSSQGFKRWRDDSCCCSSALLLYFDPTPFIVGLDFDKCW